MVIDMIGMEIGGRTGPIGIIGGRTGPIGIIGGHHHMIVLIMLTPVVLMYRIINPVSMLNIGIAHMCTIKKLSKK